MSTDSNSVIREIEESLGEWKTGRNKHLSWRLSYIQGCRDKKYNRLLMKDIFRIERLKWRAIDSLSGQFPKEEWEIVFMVVDFLYYDGDYKKFRIRVWEMIEEYHLNRLRRLKIHKAGFYQKVMHLSNRKLEMIFWLYQYSRDNHYGNPDEIICHLTDPAQVRKQKLKKINRRSH